MVYDDIPTLTRKSVNCRISGEDTVLPLFILYQIDRHFSVDSKLCLHCTKSSTLTICLSKLSVLPTTTGKYINLSGIDALMKHSIYSACTKLEIDAYVYMTKFYRKTKK